jgi:hypothetical protein
VENAFGILGSVFKECFANHLQLNATQVNVLCWHAYICKISFNNFEELTYTSKLTGSRKYYTEDDYKRGLEERRSNVHIHRWFIQTSRTGNEAIVIRDISTILLHE